MHRELSIYSDLLDAAVGRGAAQCMGRAGR